MDRLSRPASPGGGGLGYASRRGLYAQTASHHHQAGGGSAQTSPGGSPKELSPVHRHARAGSLGGAGTASTAGRRAGVGTGAGAGARAQNARAAAQRLARVMGGAGGDGGSGSDDDDDGYELSGPPIELSNTPRRTSTRSPSPSVTIVSMRWHLALACDFVVHTLRCFSILNTTCVCDPLSGGVQFCAF
jgi:hypothetical protein